MSLTAIYAHAARFLFAHESYSNLHQVYELEAVGLPMPGQEIEEVTYYQPGCDLKMSPGAKDICDWLCQAPKERYFKGKGL